MAFSVSFRPKIIDALTGYSGHKLVADVLAGITVGVVALPLAIAFAIASGMRPEAGIFTAIVAGFLIAALGGCKVQIGGPAGAFIVIVYGIVARHGAPVLLMATMLSGAVLFIMGVTKLGSLVRFIPVSIVIGFTNGIAVLIALSQVKDFFGLDIKSMPAEFFAKLGAVARNWHSFDPATVILAVVSLGIIVVWPKTYAPSDNKIYAFLSRIPGTIVTLVVGTAAVSVFHLHVATIGSRFGGIPDALPALAFPAFDWQSLHDVVASAITIALLGAIESLLCARVADSLTGDRHDPNQELMAQGVANIAAPLFGGYCATGTVARTVANIRSGAVSPISGIVHSLTLLAIVLIAAPLAVNIPLATLSAILMFVAYNMGEWEGFLHMMRFSNNYRAILVTTFLLTVIVDLTVAVEVGLAMSCIFFITRVSSLTNLESVSEQEEHWMGIPPETVEVFRLHGSLFFGSISKIEGLLDPKRAVRPITLIDMSDVLNIDTTGLDALKSLHVIVSKQGGTLVLCGLDEQPASIVHRSGFDEELGPLHIFKTVEEARDHIEGTLSASKSQNQVLT